jgi:2'-5' RNA ligase
VAEAELGPSFVPPDERETAVVIVVGVENLQLVHRDAFPAFHERGIPLHVTLLYPFVRPDQLDSALPRLAEVLVQHPSFDFTLTALKTFPRAVWLAPEPAAPFVRLTGAIEAAFPETPHWGGVFDDVIPHATLVEGVDEVRLEETLARLRSLVEPMLPVVCSADEVVVLAEQEDGRMPAAARLPLGGQDLA